MVYQFQEGAKNKKFERMQSRNDEKIEKCLSLRINVWK